MSFLRDVLDAIRNMPQHGSDKPMVYYVGGRACHHPHCECPSAKTGQAMDDDCRGLKSDSPYYYKCKRIRVNGPTPCFCCDGPCVGEPKDAADNDRLCRDFAERMARRGTANT